MIGPPGLSMKRPILAPNGIDCENANAMLQYSFQDERVMHQSSPSV